MTVINADCIAGMRGLLADNSVDAIVTDPPYELGFMGKSWDSTGVAFNPVMWRECLRVLKPGGHLIAFSGSRTYHRMACAIEDAGFEIRDQIMWLYGSGFPKSMDVSKAIDKAAGAEREVLRTERNFGASKATDGKQAFGDYAGQWDVTAPATDEARQWEGWGTALKPAHEPMVLARKPLSEKTVAANVLRWGTGALNIDGCRVGHQGGCRSAGGGTREESQDGAIGSYSTSPSIVGLGRWPANVAHDGSDEVIDAFPQAPGQQGRAKNDGELKGNAIYGAMRHRTINPEPRRGAGSAARFFYCAKASRADRGHGNNHPTVKPTELMRWLVRLVTPPGGTALDPFTGSGSTGCGAVLEGRGFVGFELSAEYCAIAKARIQAAKEST